MPLPAVPLALLGFSLISSLTSVSLSVNAGGAAAAHRYETSFSSALGSCCFLWGAVGGCFLYLLLSRPRCHCFLPVTQWHPPILPIHSVLSLATSPLEGHLPLFQEVVDCHVFIELLPETLAFRWNLVRYRWILVIGVITGPCGRGSTHSRLSAFVQISALFQIYITDMSRHLHLLTNCPFEVKKGGL